MTGESYLYLKIMTAHWQKWGARGGNYETGVYPREGSGVGPGGRALVPTLPLSSSLPRRKSFSSLDPGLFIWEMRQLFSVGNLLPSACDMIHENDRPTSCHLPVKPEFSSRGEGQSQRSFLLSGWSFFQVALDLPLVKGMYWEISHLGYIFIILPDTHFSITRREKTV